MSRRSFRDRFYTPQVANSLTSPLGIVLFGAGTAAGIALGAPILAAVGVGVLGWGGQVVAKIPRNPPTEPVEPNRLAPPWRDYVMSAQDASQRFDRIVAGMKPGPLRDRLDAMSTRMDDGVVESWTIAKRGHEIDGALSQVPTDHPRRQLAWLQQQPDATSPASKQTMAALQAQIDSAERLQTVASDAHSRLRLLDARFDELVARAVEVSVGTGDTELLGNEVEGLVDELESLRLALDETERPRLGEIGASGQTTGPDT